MCARGSGNCKNSKERWRGWFWWSPSGPEREVNHGRNPSSEWQSAQEGGIEGEQVTKRLADGDKKGNCLLCFIASHSNNSLPVLFNLILRPVFRCLRSFYQRFSRCLFVAVFLFDRILSNLLNIRLDDVYMTREINPPNVFFQFTFCSFKL